MFFIVVNVCRSDDVDKLAPFIVLFDCLFFIVCRGFVNTRRDGQQNWI